MKKVPRLALEVVSVETVGNCFQVNLRDVSGQQIMASLHPSCREIVIKQVRRGRILLLKEVAMFSCGGSGGNKFKNVILVVMDHCIERVVKH